MNTDTKWEAVDLDDIRNNDSLRLTHESGDVLHGTYRMFGAIGTSDYIETRTGRISVSCIEGFSFERAVPERTLPAGLYIGKDEEPCDTAVYRSNGESIETDGNGTWEPIDEWDTIDDLVRLVPVTEVEEAEKRARLKALQDADALVQEKYAAHGAAYIGPYVIRNNFVEFHSDEATELEAR